MLNVDAQYLRDYAAKLKTASGKISDAKNKLASAADGSGWNCPERRATIVPYLDDLRNKLAKLSRYCENLGAALTNGASQFDQCSNDAQKYAESLQKQFDKKWGFEADVYTGGTRTVTATPVPSLR